ncbi:tRNA uridine 5-carboxymethylaminomethyl modification protein GidA [Candidatus Magnetobacterium bavaricum]|uniref:tRNA uridine 5-carboxymethylaminomethyl modification enzyme MnmG n=1 Tax=Candidatus Magnetobacterium bavaricum TaxID=29290 RepID=A0A0F3GN07_9BACT|nr:tRNA uridine 5-carboxymethylaminomethyl modification protein GidA [Candidatus Magnetobacterium bavaricum]
MFHQRDYDVIVIGAGHAGCEAALACARIGCSTCIFTSNLDTIAQMSCNPAIGGLAKGHLVREIDALGGQMARTADYSGIQFRMLNRSKGPAVWSLRSQNDRVLYRLHMKRTLEATRNLDIKQSIVEGLVVDPNDNRIKGVIGAFGASFGARAVIVTTGTFLNGVIHVGLEHSPAGRAGEGASVGLSESLRSLGFKMGRLKTGTPPRIDSRSIDFSKTTPQWGDDPPVPFSFSTTEITNPQLPCFITYTNSATHEIITEGLGRSPLYSGKITGVGPRYCPSIEDKVVRFAQRQRHQVFLEPDGLDTREYYANGISTSLPYDVQVRYVRTIDGLQDAELMRPGYAVEYDSVHSTQLRHTLETKSVEGLYLAGQINGTSGYEEAAAQGLIAGINAAMKLKGRPPLILQRHEAYIAVMLDDLVTNGIVEPYRMFTSRAEFRLLLRNDNAELRLKEHGYRVGLVPEAEYQGFCGRLERLNAELQRLNTQRAHPDTINEALAPLNVPVVTESVSLRQLLKRPEVTYDLLRRCFPPEQPIDATLAQLIETEVKYEGYIMQQCQLVEKTKKMQGRHIPADFDYRSVSGLSREVIARLEEVRPADLGQAARISGVTPAAVSLIMVILEKRRRRKE